MKNAKPCGPKGYDPDDPVVVAAAAAIDMVQWELSLYLQPAPD
jgi:hypothetical protein